MVRRNSAGSRAPLPSWEAASRLGCRWPLAALLAGHHPIHVVDLPGFGYSGDPGRVLDVTEHAEHLAAWLDAAGLGSAAMLGNSFGCQVAVDLALRRPDRVRCLILVGPTIDPGARTAARQIIGWMLPPEGA